MCVCACVGFGGGGGGMRDEIQSQPLVCACGTHAGYKRRASGSALEGALLCCVVFSRLHFATRQGVEAALTAASEDDKACWAAQLEKEGAFSVSSAGGTHSVTAAMVAFKKEEKKVTGRCGVRCACGSAFQTSCPAPFPFLVFVSGGETHRSRILWSAAHCTCSAF